MSVSSNNEVRKLYESTAELYDAMMDEEIQDPLYDQVLSDLAHAVVDVPGAILDSSCGSGHMLQRLAEEFCSERELLGVDLSAAMVQCAQVRLGQSARLIEGDMAALTQIADSTCAAVISYFAIHHVDVAGLEKCFCEWNRVLGVGGQLVLAAWEGCGFVDYGDDSDVVALRYTEEEIIDAMSQTALQIVRHSVKPVEEMEMDAFYLVAAKVEQ